MTTHQNRAPLVAVLATAFASLPITQAATLTFDGGTAGTARTWSASANWDTNTAPAVGDDLVIGGTALSAGASLIGNGSYMALNSSASDYTATVRSVTFDNSLSQFPSGTLELRNSSATTAFSSTISLNTAGVEAIRVLSGNVIMESRNSTAQLTVNLGYTGQSNFNIASGSTLTITSTSVTTGTPATAAAVITGTGGIRKTGQGTLTLSGSTANTYSGGTTIESGTVRFGANGATLGSGPIVIGATGGGNASLISANAGYTMANAITVAANSGGTLTLGSTSTGSFTTTFSGPISLNGNLTVSNVAPSGYRIATSGTISGEGGITKIGSGEWRVAGANSYAGGTLISEGLLTATNTSGSAVGSGPLTVATGALLGGNGIIGAATTVNGGLRPGTLTATTLANGVLTFTSSLNLANAQTHVFDVSSTIRGTGYDALDVDGLLTYGGDLSVNFSAAATADSFYDIFDLGGGFTGNFTSISIGGTHVLSLTNSGGIWSGLDSSNNLVFTFSIDTGDLVVSPIPEPSTFAALAGLAAFGLCATRRRRRA